MGLLGVRSPTAATMQLSLLTLIPVLAVLAVAETRQEGRSFPLDRTRSGLLVVRVTVDGREGDFIVDTGSEITLVDAKMLFLSRFGAGRPDTAAKGGPSFKVKQATLCLCSGADKAYFHMPVAVANLSGLEDALGRKIDGLLGIDFLHQFDSVSIDFESERLTVHGR